MLKSDWVRAISETHRDIGKEKAEEIVNTLFTAMWDELDQSGEILIQNIGRIYVKIQKARIARNPRSGEKLKVPARRRVAFKASKIIREHLVKDEKKSELIEAPKAKTKVKK